MSTHAVARLADLPRVPAGGPEDAAWTPIRHALGLRAFGVNAWHGEHAGDLVIQPHDEVPENACGCAGHEELYLVLEGRATFTVGDEAIDAPAGTLVAVPPNLHREAVAAADDTLVLVVGAPPGGVYAPGDWERRAIEYAGLV